MNTKNATKAKTGAKPTKVDAKPATNRFKMLTLQNGEQVKRVDYIRQMWAEKHSRSEITKMVSEIAGEKVAYQIIFAATKGYEGGPEVVAATVPKAASDAPKAA